MSSSRFTIDDLALAFEFVSSGPPMEHNAYLSIDTGRIYWISELASVEEEIPDDLETSDRYIAIPHRNDLDLGRNLALRFAIAKASTRFVRRSRHGCAAQNEFFHAHARRSARATSDALRRAE
ncbi:MAG: hypothetical protein K2Y16_08810 [Burkholderiales bacterium]|nr:hypothetical protein [Burkholderiales bacterium]